MKAKWMLAAALSAAPLAAMAEKTTPANPILENNPPLAEAITEAVEKCKVDGLFVLPDCLNALHGAVVETREQVKSDVRTVHSFAKPFVPPGHRDDINFSTRVDAVKQLIALGADCQMRSFRRPAWTNTSVLSNQHGDLDRCLSTIAETQFGTRDVNEVPEQLHLGAILIKLGETSAQFGEELQAAVQRQQPKITIIMQ
jgi:hypothetical protein